MRSRRWKFAASLGLLLCLSASIAVGGFAADASVAEQGYPGGGDWGRPSQAYGYAPDDSVLAPDGHYYKPNSWMTVSEATCINKEKQVRYCVWMEWDWWSLQYVQCNHADYGEVGEVDPNNHVNTITINKKEATCTEEGYTGDLYCKDCKTTTQTGSSIPAKGHRWGQWKTTKSATCTAQGEETRECKKCGKTEERETKVLGHDWDEGKVTTPATCTENGVKTYTCKRCKTTKTETVPKTEHTAVVVPAKAATCTETGLTEGKECEVCHATLVKQEVTPALGHDWDDWKVTKEATCTETGVKTRTCKRDFSHTETVTIAKTEHTAVVVPAKAATCTETGLTEGKECKICGATLVEQKEIPALDHDWDNGKVTTPATCTKDGVKTYTCKRDSSHTYTEAIPATDHMYGKEVVEPTCTEEGYTKYTCAYCGDSYTTDKKPALDHDWDDWKVTKEATCTETGVKTRTCKRDSSHTDTEAIPATDHMYGKEVVEPTCTEEGYTKYTCAYCGDSYTTDKKPALDHDPIAVPGKEPTCTETGLTEGSKCQRCGKTLTAQETIPALGHAWNTTSTGVDNCVNVSFRHENETITLCPICGVQNGTQRLNKVTLYTAHAKLVVLRGVLENGMEAMTVAFYEPGISSVTACQRCGAVRDSFSSGASLPQAAENAHFTVDASLVDGYTVMLVQADGTETVLTPGISDGKAIFDVDMKGQGARLLHLVPTTAA